MNRPAHMARINARQRTIDACNKSVARDFAELPVVPMPVDIDDPIAFPEIAEARAHLASLSPERRAELERPPS